MLLIKKYNLNFVFYNKWGIGDNLHDICYLQELHNKGIISNPTIFIGKSFNSIKILDDIFPDIKIKKNFLQNHSLDYHSGKISLEI